MTSEMYKATISSEISGLGDTTELEICYFTMTEFLKKK